MFVIFISWFLQRKLKRNLELKNNRAMAMLKKRGLGFRACLSLRFSCPCLWLSQSGSLATRACQAIRRETATYVCLFSMLRMHTWRRPSWNGGIHRRYEDKTARQPFTKMLWRFDTTQYTLCYLARLQRNYSHYCMLQALLIQLSMHPIFMTHHEFVSVPMTAHWMCNLWNLQDPQNCGMLSMQTIVGILRMPLNFGVLGLLPALCSAMATYNIRAQLCRRRQHRFRFIQKLKYHLRGQQPVCVFYCLTLCR